MNAQPCWRNDTVELQRPPLTQNASCDICIIGAGISGLTCAYLAAREGFQVIVADDGPIAGGETGNTTAHLSNALDDRYFEFERVHGPSKAKLCAESHSAAIDRIEDIIRAEEIACDFCRLDGFLFMPPGEAPEILDRELAAAVRAGLTDVQRMPTIPGLPTDLGEALRFGRQAQFDPIAYCAGLAKAIERRGGRIFSQTHVDSIENGGPTKRVFSDKGVIRAAHVIVATNAPVIDSISIDLKQAPYRTYALAARVARGSVPRALFWDTSDTAGDRDAPYHYVRHLRASAHDVQGADGDFDVLIIGGEDHRTGQAFDGSLRWNRLEHWARERFGIHDVMQRWSGQVMEPVDYAAFIGQHPQAGRGIYIATGDSGMGMTHGTIAGILLTDLIADRPNPWAELYDPKRTSLATIGTIVSQNANAVRQYADWFQLGDVTRIEEIPAEGGAIVRNGLTLRAVYRDCFGNTHTMSAVCPHLGGIVRWNPTNKSWDCPCHGSRFDAYGQVICGPAIAGLKSTAALLS